MTVTTARPASPAPAGGTLNGIQYLRAFAAIAVVLFHAAERTGQHFAIGAAGVDIFFVISGFVMMVMSERRPVTPGRFMLDRIKRILPLYWIVTTIMIAGAVLGLFPNMVLTLGHVLGSLFFIPVRAPGSGEIWPVLVQGWTLNYEMFFYLVFAASLFLPRRFRLAAVIGTFCILVITGLMVEPQNAALQTYTRPIMFEFVAGMVLGCLWLKGWIPSGNSGIALAAFGLGGFALIYVLRLEFDERICGPLAAALVLAALAIEKEGNMPKIPVISYFGNSSYSIYLWHTLAISVVAKAAALAALPPAAALVIAIIGGILLGVIAYECIERPLNAWLKNGTRGAPDLRARFQMLVRSQKT